MKISFNSKTAPINDHTPLDSQWPALQQACSGLEPFTADDVTVHLTTNAFQHCKMGHAMLNVFHNLASVEIYALRCLLLKNQVDDNV